MKLNNYTATPFSPTSPNTFWLALSLILVAGLLLRLPDLNESLWNDEIWSTRVLLGNPTALYQTIIDDFHPPFYQVFMYGWIRFFGDSELSVRMPPLLLGMSSIFLVYALASRVVERRTALLASFLMTASPAHIWYSQEARSYSALLFSLLLSLVAYLQLKGPDPRRIWFLVYVGALFSGAMTHYYLGVYVVLISMACLLERHRRKWFILTMNVLILSCLGAWVITKVVQSGLPPGGGYLRAFTFHAFWRLFSTWFLFGNSWGKEWRHWPMFSAQIFFLVIFVYGIALLLLQKKTHENESARHVVGYLFVLPVFLLAVSSFGFKGYIERSVLVALPFFYIAIARGIIGVLDGPIPPVSGLFGSFGRTFKTLGAVCIVVVILLNIFTLKEYFRRNEEWTVYKPNPDWRSTARYLENEISRSSERPVIFAVIPPLELTYYDSRFKYVWGDALSGEDAQRYWGIYFKKTQFGNVHDVLSKTGARAFFLIHNRYWSGSFRAVFKNLLKDSRLEYQNMQTFKGIEVHRFMLRADLK